MNSSGGRWYVVVLTAFAAVAMIWGIAEKNSSNARHPGLIATER